MDKELEESAHNYYINCIPSDELSFKAGGKGKIICSKDIEITKKK